MNLFPYSQEYLEYLDIERGFSPTSQVGFTDDLRMFFFFLDLEEYFPERVEVQAITLEHIQNFLIFLKEIRSNEAVTRNRKLASVKNYFHFLETSGYIEENPAQYLHYAKRSKKPPVYLSSQESQQLLQATWLDSMFPYRDQAVMRLFLQTGCRLQELVGLQMDHIDLREGFVRYQGKGNVERQVPLTDKTTLALEEHLKRRLSVYQDIPNVFLNQHGEPIGRRGVRWLFHRIRKKAGINRQGLSVHKLRHTCLTLLFKMGVDISILQELAGHKDIRSTQIYVHVSKEEMKREMDKHPLG